jgi:hypothetical protein
MCSLVDLMWKDGTPALRAITRRLDIKTDAPGKMPRHTKMLDIMFMEGSTQEDIATESWATPSLTGRGDAP